MEQLIFSPQIKKKIFNILVLKIKTYTGNYKTNKDIQIKPQPSPLCNHNIVTSRPTAFSV